MRQTRQPLRLTRARIGEKDTRAVRKAPFFGVLAV
jgi:hypothetical protein